MTASVNVKDLFAHAMSEFTKGNFGESINLLGGVLEHDAENKLAVVTRGTAQLKLGESNAAIRDFTRALEIDPGYSRAYHLRGLALEKQGNTKEALEDFSRAIELDSDYGAAYFSRATLRSKLGDSEAATDDIEMVTHLTNRNIETFANENNVWRSRQMQLETIMETDLDR
jgi:Tfp pilus assembly protein PilF